MTTTTAIVTGAALGGLLMFAAITIGNALGTREGRKAADRLLDRMRKDVTRWQSDSRKT